jgi:hypothetical protein
MSDQKSYQSRGGCAECLKDLQRFLRQDDAEKRPAFFALSSTNISKTDLVPLLMAYPDNKDVVFNLGTPYLTIEVDWLPIHSAYVE